MFNHKFKLEFETLKKTRCDTSEAANINSKMDQKYANLESIVETRNKRGQDRQRKGHCMLYFDMQNVFSFPQAKFMYPACSISIS